MKFFLFIDSFLSAFSIAFAQPVFDTSYVPKLGYTYTYLYPNSVNYDSLQIEFGADKTWSFDFDNAFGSATTTFVSPASTAFAKDFPAATLCASTPGVFPTYNYYGADAKGVIAYGNVFDATSYVSKTINKAPAPYSLPFALTFGTTLTDSIWYKSIVVGSGASRSAGYVLDTLAYVGYGTLFLQGRQYNHVALVREGTLTRDSSGGQQGISAALSWWLPGYPAPILILDTYVYAGKRRGGPSYNDNIPAATRPLSEPARLAYPNPASEHISLPGLSANVLEVIVYDRTGLAHTLPVANGQADTRPLAPGLYWALSQGRRFKFVKQ